VTSTVGPEPSINIKLGSVESIYIPLKLSVFGRISCFLNSLLQRIVTITSVFAVTTRKSRIMAAQRKRVLLSAPQSSRHSTNVELIFDGNMLCYSNSWVELIIEMKMKISLFHETGFLLTYVIGSYQVISVNITLSPT
jgi:hypothetical protein